MDGLNPIVSGIAAGVGVTVLIYLAGRMKPVRSDEEGWFAIRPGWIFHSLFVACMLLVLIFIFALVTLPSRPDWRQQITPLLLLLVGFGAGGIWTGWVAYARDIRWNAEQIVVRRRLGPSAAFPWSAVSRVHTNGFTSEYVITFHEGQKLRVPTMMKGARQLAEQLASSGFR